MYRRDYLNFKIGSVLIYCQHEYVHKCMIMPISWQYTDVYGVIIHYIIEHLDPTNYLLNFSIVALHELRPKVIIRFTLKNIKITLDIVGPNFWREKSWKICLMVYVKQ